MVLPLQTPDGAKSDPFSATCYSQYIPAQYVEDMEELVRVSGLKEEIALVRLRIRDLLADGSSPNDLIRAIELLNRLISTNHRLIHF